MYSLEIMKYTLKLTLTGQRIKYVKYSLHTQTQNKA